jgi:inositol hexakisphosphate/diphosphoinositol-pentakisphosphate kinase
MRSVLEKGGHFEGINRKIQLRPLEFRKVEKEGVVRFLPTDILVILKWGGELTQLGETQAIKLG